jgi:predicted 2-oxoglutarate/Fe(II)-dependent dioxygenase YbiX|tara:strand:+ start:1452 stop:1940 length:489 start_codon:yes stop_codon:yes gene_type:complete
LNIFHKNIGFDWCLNKSYIIDNIIKKHTKHQYNSYQHNFQITDGEMKTMLIPLFNIFFSIAKEKFYLTQEEPNYKFFSYVSNKDRNVSVLHDHTRTALANGIFYINVPKGDGGELLIRKSKYEDLIFPVLEGDLMIFHGNIKHRPLPVNTEDYRISINMEAI